jgi:hypothetical protein
VKKSSVILEWTSIKRRDRRTLAWYDERTLTARCYRALVADGRERLDSEAPSKVNPGIPNGVALGIMERAIGGTADDAAVDPLAARNLCKIVGVAFKEAATEPQP